MVDQSRPTVSVLRKTVNSRDNIPTASPKNQSHSPTLSDTGVKKFMTTLKRKAIKVLGR